MQDLKRLIEIIETGGAKTLPLVDPTDHVSLEGQLYQIIRNSSVVSDKEACLLLYGNQKLTPSYRMLKSRLRKRLLNNLLLMELTESHLRTFRITLSECLTLVQQANKLLILGEFQLAERVAAQLVEVAEKAELNDMLSKGYEIKVVADSQSQNRGSFERNLKLMQHYSFLDAKEREASILYNRSKFEVSYNIINSSKLGDDYRDSLLKLKELWELTGSSLIYDNYHMINVGYCELTGDYEAILRAIEDAEELVDKGLLNKFWFNYRFNNFIKVYAYLRLGRLEEGLKYSKLYINSLVEGSTNWFAFLENYLILALHLKDYDLAVQLCTSAIENGIYENDRVRLRDRWLLFIRYLQFFTPDDSSIRPDIQLTEGEEVFSLSKDKEGFNLPLLIVEYLEMIPKLDSEDMAQYAARFSKYSSKYLKREVWDRARLFIKLLILSMKEEGEKLEQKASPLLQKLKNTPPPRDPVAEVEIVPYEHLWELVLERLQQRVKK